MNHRLLLVAASAIVAGSTSSVSASTTLPAASVSGFAQANYNISDLSYDTTNPAFVYSTSDTYSIAGVGESTASASVAFDRGGAVEASMYSGGPFAQAQVDLIYSIEFAGPVGTTVPVYVKGTTSVTAEFVDNDGNFSGGPGEGEAALILYGGGVDLLDVQDCLNINIYYCGGKSTTGVSLTGIGNVFTPVNIVINLAANYVYGVELLASVNNSNGYTTTVAGVDPTFNIDPSFTSASEYTLVESQGISNDVSGVPEPTTWAMMLLGLGAVGFALRASNPQNPRLSYSILL